MIIKISKERNNALIDLWSIIHLGFGIVFGWVMSPAIAVVLLVLWEPFEILLLSPLLARVGITFGHETLRNSMSDIVFDTIGVLFGVFILRLLIDPPFHLF